MSDDVQDFQRFMKQREAASDAYVQGEMAPLSEIVARDHAATFFAPMGGATHGAQEVADRYERDAHLFERGSHFDFDILEMGASGDVGYWVGFMRGAARMRGKPEPIPMNLRVTEIFRREGGEWKMVHRHADSLAESPAATPKDN